MLTLMSQVWSGYLGQPLVDSGDNGHGWVMALAFSPAGDLLASAHRDGHVRVHRPNLSLVVEIAAHSSSVNAIAWFSFSSVFLRPFPRSLDGTRLYTGSDDKTVSLFDSKSWKKLCTLTGHDGAVRAVAVSPLGVHFASAGTDFVVRIWFVW